MQLYAGTIPAARQLDSASPIPLWYQLVQLLKLGIESGEFRAEAPISTEENLVTEFRVARATVRRALDELQREGWLERRGPRRPLVVKQRPVLQEATKLAGLFSEGFVSRGYRMSIEVRSAEVVIDARVAMELSVRAGAPLYRLERVFKAGDEPVACEIAWLPKALFPRLLQQQLDRPITTLAEEKYGTMFSSARQHLAARLASAQETKKLRLDQPAVVLAVGRLTRDQLGRPIEYMESILRADRYDFVMALESSNRSIDIRLS